MLFNSLDFIIFFPIVVFLYYFIPHKYRCLLLLVASYYFYMCWKAEYIFLILFSTSIDYYSAIQIGLSKTRFKRKLFLFLSISTNLGLLFTFKYFNFFSESVRQLFDQFNIFYNSPSFDLLLPVGISFYTFQTLSYSIDVYLGNKKPEKSFLIFALYVSFFPQLVAGPIERSTRLLPQFHKKISFNYSRIRSGLLLIAWGFFKKVVIADNLALVVDPIYNNPTYFQGIPLLIATYAFAFQIFCDFSGYSDIAIGTARVMGFDLMKNFNRPYFSTSVSDFWKRWHISLSSWFKDYLYIPLGGNRVNKLRLYFNLLVVFLLSGLWHGANWTFIAWGGLHGLFLIFSISTRDLRNRFIDKIKIDKNSVLLKGVNIFITFHLISFSWIFFRAKSLTDAWYIIKNMVLGIELKLSYGFNHGKEFFIFLAGLICLMELVHIIQNKIKIDYWLLSKPVWFRFGFYYLFLMGIIAAGNFGANSFIYFQF